MVLGLPELTEVATVGDAPRAPPPRTPPAPLEVELAEVLYARQASKLS